ncbi:MAG TPA: hypothetical protein VGS11_00870 [Candidatus Bathyarchaeia archaeon]|nr:hypothetical protein [Candidatus Bathyarchaeia archaeon]
MSRWVRRTFTWYFSAKIFLAILVLAVSAATIATTSTIYQAEMGSAYNITNGILVGDKGFSKPSVGTAATGTCPAGNVTFGTSPGTANNLLIAGDIVYDIQVNATATTPLNKCFTVTLSISGFSPKTLTIASGTSVTAGWTIDCKLDIGTTSLPGSPFSFKVTI